MGQVELQHEEDLKENSILQADREWQQHLEMEEQLKRQWHMEQEQERERHQIRLLMSDTGPVDQSGDFLDDNDDQTWDFNEDNQVNNVPINQMPRDTEHVLKNVAMTKKEQKQMEKALKQQQEKEEKERKKQEKDIKRRSKKRQNWRQRN